MIAASGLAQTGGPSFLIVEVGVSLIAFAAAICWPGVGATWFSKAERFLGRLARRRGLSVLAVGGAALVLRLATGFPATPVRDFVMFPLPLGDREYGDYMAQVRKRFPAGGLRTVMRGGHEFAVGPVADLGVLFPGVGRQACVRTATTGTPLVNSR